MTGVGTLRAVPLFAQLRETDLAHLAGLLRQKEYPRNRVISFAHDPSDAFYVVLAGQVKVMMIAEDGREVVLSLMGGGEFFGEAALMDDEPFAASVIAVEDSTLLVLRREDFRHCITEMPEMAFGLLRALCSRLREADHRIGGLMLLDVTGRIAHLLLDLAARNDGVAIADVPTHQVIAQMVGSTRETVSRTIGGFAGQGWIENSDDGIRIISRGELESAAGQLLRRRAKTPPFAKERRRVPE